MKKHSFLNLKLGLVQQYTMIISKSNLQYWKDLGWLEYTDIGLPKGEENAWMVYGEFKKKTETLIFNKPLLLREVTRNLLIGRKITGFSAYLGTYGMGGPGFFGFLLDNLEYLTYTVWGADKYIFVNDRLIDCSPEFYTLHKPWIANYTGYPTWDELTKFIAQSEIVDLTLNKHICEIQLKKGKETIIVNFCKNDLRIPKKAGKVQNAYQKGVISDYILFQHKNATLIV